VYQTHATLDDGHAQNNVSEGPNVLIMHKPSKNHFMFTVFNILILAAVTGTFEGHAFVHVIRRNRQLYYYYYYYYMLFTLDACELSLFISFLMPHYASFDDFIMQSFP
jgi:hypothetical protein